ncbi:unnamed protein product [Lupinus luteus]|uniref:Cellulose synthase-like protein E6 n=1 Tax=Lupinus luteus TaxID=3873 RepID=A0AAV1X4H5_LUPLU
MGEKSGETEERVGLFERKEGRKRGIYKVFASTIFAGICLIWVYRLRNIPNDDARYWYWLLLFMSELGFGLYWIITQSVRWRIVYHTPFRHTLLNRYNQENLGGVDIFVCTPDPILEPPMIVINTVLSAMAYNYPSNKLTVYLSDDGGSELTFYALFKASIFSKHWLPFCRRFNIQPRSPQPFFATQNYSTNYAQQCFSIKKLYESMKRDIEWVVANGKVPDDEREQHNGFSEWNHKTTKQDHQSIVQIMIDGRDTNAVDEDGYGLPTLVYMAREKRPNYPHHFKAGAINALSYNNLTKNDHYANSCLATDKLELAGICGHGAALYCGTGCFHRRESISGTSFKDYIPNKDTNPKREDKRTLNELNEASKALATCTFEKDTQWGKEMGLVYGIPVEDIATGLVISCRGWKSIYYNPERKAFLRVAPTTLDVALVQQKRWSEGMFQVFFSKYCPFIYGHRKINLGLQMGYCVYLLWAPMSLPTLSYVIVSPISLLRGIPLFPQLTSLWFLPFAYAFLATNAYSLGEALSCGSTIKGWWNLQRMRLIRRTTSYFFSFIDNITKQFGLSQANFVITDKVVSEDVQKRYEQEVIDFGNSSNSIMLTILATVALLNLFGLVGGIMRIVVMDLGFSSSSQLMIQIIVSALVVMVYLPVYEALFIRTDKGCISSSIMFKSIEARP